MSIDGFQFEGRDVTARQLKREIPAYGLGQLQSALEAGCKTLPELVVFCERRVSARSRLSHKKGCASFRHGVPVIQRGGLRDD